MKKKFINLLLVIGILIIFSIPIFASETINVKDYIKGKFPVIFNIYLASLGDLDEYEKEFIDLLQNLPEEEQKNFAKEVYDNGFSKEILKEVLANIKKIEEDKLEIKKSEFKEENVAKIEEFTGTGKWFHYKWINPIDDTTITTFRIASNSGKSVSGKPIELVLWYQSGKKSGRTILSINWHDYLGSDSSWVTYRFGTEKAKEESWTISNDHTATYYFPGIFSSSKGTIKFIRKLMTVDKFVVQVTPYSESPTTAVFDIRGLRNAVEQFNDILHYWIKE